MSRAFPIRGGSSLAEPGTTVPWEMAEKAHETLVRLHAEKYYGENAPSLEYLSQRHGGWSAGQFACYYLGHDHEPNVPEHQLCIMRVFVKLHMGRWAHGDLRQLIAECERVTVLNNGGGVKVSARWRSGDGCEETKFVVYDDGDIDHAASRILQLIRRQKGEPDPVVVDDELDGCSKCGTLLLRGGYHLLPPSHPHSSTTLFCSTACLKSWAPPRRLFHGACTQCTEAIWDDSPYEVDVDTQKLFCGAGLSPWPSGCLSRWLAEKRADEKPEVIPEDDGEVCPAIGCDDITRHPSGWRHYRCPSCGHDWQPGPKRPNGIVFEAAPPEPPVRVILVAERCAKCKRQLEPALRVTGCPSVASVLTDRAGHRFCSTDCLGLWELGWLCPKCREDRRDRDAKCCNAECGGEWGTGCWHCHHPRFYRQTLTECSQCDDSLLDALVVGESDAGYCILPESHPHHWSTKFCSPGCVKEYEES